MKNLMIVWIILSIQLNTSIAGVDEVGTSFTYQGELIDNGSQANGTYDLQINLYVVPTSGIPIAGVQIDDIEVVNGLFSTELDFGDFPFSGQERYLQLNVRPGDSTDDYSLLLPRSRINVTPYAIQAAFVENSGSPWEEINGGVLRSVNDIAVGEGTGSLSTAKATINSALNQDALRVRVSGGTKFVVQADGGVAVGTNQVAPENGLLVNGEVKQPLNQHGFAKAGMRFTCGNSGTTIFESFNNENTDDFTVNNSLPEAGRCVVAAPFDITDSYIVANTFATNIPRGVSCGKTTDGGGEDVIECNAYTPLNGTRNDAVVTLLLF